MLKAKAAAAKWAAVGTLVVSLLTGSLAMSGNEAFAADCSNGYVGLTFDDGPNPSNTTTLLNALKLNGLRATLFNLGQNAQNYPSLVRDQQAAGMWIGNHSWSHPHMTQLSGAQMASEITSTQQAIQTITGAAPKLFRPPYGETNAALKSIEAQNGLTEVIWNVDSQDWNGATAAQIAAAAGRLQNGDVILMHDQYQTTIQAIPQIAQNLKSRGLCSGMISTSTGRAVAPDGGGGGGTPGTGTKVEAESMTRGGQYASTISSPFSGVALYANNDLVKYTQNFTSGTHTFSLRGASSNSAMARVDLKIGGVTKGSFYFGGSSPAVYTLSNVSHGTGNQEIQLVCTTDNGTWDVYLDYLEISG
ncbi:MULTISPECIES: polysaccharide deacetylase family protein [unclassified Paenibacillus]|uniref:polysaccharide deacetylase family protein n=1 Tax=unclassified Paenibacillus TaxID=185978 RepID=UPI0009571FFE|nr:MULTISPECIES: polysaccharide deacetylase family protein [unclassified Paenibacillus]ASS65388.1 polysaccharide deacetylase family protein [Paenibacillus sp. RUD330]SIQ37926.1 Carbohydrate binding module (family 6) [Paenibacillus sp. RU4X]SIQ60121.1 Carbohydrate binding module (family 6) [Paenibacillus sp. RU4T]